jgi:WD40 repeat protein
MPHLVLCLALVAVGQTQIRVTYLERLEKATRTPVVFSPDGTQILYISGELKSEADGRNRSLFSYCLANSDGTKQRKLFASPVDWDDYLNAVTDSAFSDDGKSIAVATTDNGKTLRAEDPGKAVPGICDLDGNVRAIPCELGSTSGFAFAGNEFVYLDTPGLASGQGYKLKIIRNGKTETIESHQELAAMCLRISPDGSRAIFFTTAEIHSTEVQVRMVKLKTGEKLDSPKFHSQDATFDGRPQLFWDAYGEGFFCHVSTHQESKWPYELTHFDFRTGKGYVAAPTRNIGATCVLDTRHVAVWQPDGHGCSVVNVSNRDQYSMPENNYIIGGRDRRVVIADLERDAIYCADIELLQPGQPPATAGDETEEIEEFE